MTDRVLSHVFLHGMLPGGNRDYIVDFVTLKVNDVLLHHVVCVNLQLLVFLLLALAVEEDDPGRLGDLVEVGQLLEAAVVEVELDDVLLQRDEVAGPQELLLLVLLGPFAFEERRQQRLVVVREQDPEPVLSRVDEPLQLLLVLRVVQKAGGSQHKYRVQ